MCILETGALHHSETEFTHITGNGQFRGLVILPHAPSTVDLPSRLASTRALLHATPDNFCNLPGKKRWNRIPHLVILISSPAHEEVVVRERLCPGRLAHRKASALVRVMMDEVMPILRDVADYGG